MKIIVKVKTKAGERKVVKLGDNNYEVWVKEIPEQGKANMAIIKLLAKYFKIPQDSIKIIAGKSSHRKVISF